ncbi:hypothetical protein D3C85_1058180 [compost metagenome]
MEALRKRLDIRTAQGALAVEGAGDHGLVADLRQVGAGEVVLFHQELQHLYTGDGFHADVELGELGSGVFVAFDGQAELVDQALGLRGLFGFFGKFVQQG